ncbi:MAG: hypothetical protein E4H14_02845 [Candidatus Thorarchaeota archaeon]|nr:MAG: hypothetical protein E4H14_02845 [Candidatus Thorarchaeota archaeon]
METEIIENRPRWRYSLTPSDASLLILFTVLFLPSSVGIQGGGTGIAYEISSLMWRVIFYMDGTVGLGITLYAIAHLQYIFFKYILVLQVSRYYRWRTTKQRVWIVAILSELQWLIMYDVVTMIRIIQTGADWTATLWILPIPFVLLSCVLLLFLVPRPGSEPTWIEQEEVTSWWKK